MKKLALIITLAFFSLTFTCPAATCTGASDCKACKNCNSCKHCKKDGGSCGACKKK